MEIRVQHATWTTYFTYLHVTSILNRFRQILNRFWHVPSMPFHSILGRSLVLIGWSFHPPLMSDFSQSANCATSAGSYHLKVGNCLSRSHSFKTFRQLPCRICAHLRAINCFADEAGFSRIHLESSWVRSELYLEGLSVQKRSWVKAKDVNIPMFSAWSPRLHLYHGKARATGPQSAPKSGQGKRLC